MGIVTICGKSGSSAEFAHSPPSKDSLFYKLRGPNFSLE